MLKKTQVRPKALRTPGTLPAAKAGSTIIERGVKVRTRPASIPNIALTKRIVQPYLSYPLAPLIAAIFTPPVSRFAHAFSL
jgi:hypothetical protein